MRFAVVLFGQARDYKKGHSTLMEFIRMHPESTFFFFYHVWKLNEGDRYSVSTHRTHDPTHLIYTSSILEDLQSLYHPLAYEEEPVVHLPHSYTSTLAYKNNCPTTIKNAPNILYQIYSRNKARNIFHRYLKESSAHFDFVITTRFDIQSVPLIHHLDPTKTYVNREHLPRRIMPDTFIMTSPLKYVEWFTLYDDMESLLNNSDLMRKMHSYKETLRFNIEELIMAQYLYHHGHFNDVVYFQGGLF